MIIEKQPEKRWLRCSLLSLCLWTVPSFASTEPVIVQSRGVDARVDYRALAKRGPWDDRNYQLTAEDLALLHPDEQPPPGVPLYHRVQYWKSQPDVKALPLYPDSVELMYRREQAGPAALAKAAEVSPGPVAAPLSWGAATAKNQDSPTRVIDLPITTTGTVQCEVKANPAATRQAWALAACNDQFGGVQLFLSTNLSDAAPAWTRVAPSVSGSFGDASLVWSADGSRAWLAAVEPISGQPRPVVYALTVADNGIVTAAAPVSLGTSAGDKPRLHFDGVSQRLFAVWISNFEVNVATSSNNGTSWSFPEAVPNVQALSADVLVAEQLIGQQLTRRLLISMATAFRPDGNFCDASLPCEVRVAVSNLNAGPAQLQPVIATLRARNGVFQIPAARTRSIRYYTRMAAAPTAGAVNPGRVYMAWVDLSDRSPAANPPTAFDTNNATVRTAFSDDGGLTWTNRGDFFANPTTSCSVAVCIDRFNPGLVVDHNGVVHLTWQDTRASGFDRNAVDVYYAYSRNGGAAWLPNGQLRISSQSSPIPTTTTQWGDYTGLTVQRPALLAGGSFARNQLLSVWTDARGNPAQTRGYSGVFSVLSNPVYTWANNGGQPPTFVCRNATITRNLSLATDLQVLRPMALSILTDTSAYSTARSLSVQSLTPNPSAPVTLTVPVLGTTDSHNVSVAVRAADSLIGQPGVIARTDVSVPFEIRRENQRPVITAPTVPTFEPSLRVQPTNGTTLVREGNATDVVNVSLAGPPGPASGATATYTVVNPNASRFTVSPTTLTFTQANWNTPQAVTVSAVDNNVADGDEILPLEFRGADANPSGFRDNFFTDVSVVDNDLVQLLVGEPSGTLTNRFVEGGSTFYSLSLSSRPSGNVTVTVTADPVLRINGQQTQTLTFTPETFGNGQLVTVTAVNDNVARGIYRANITHVLSGAAPFAGVPAPTVDIEVTDNDQAGVELVGATTDVVEGGQLTYTLRLTSQPTANVTLTPTATAGVAVSAPLTFTPANWNTAQTVTVSATDDQLVQGRREAYVRNVVGSADPFYSLASLASSFGFSISDNDVAAVSISQTSVNLTEGGAASSYTVSLLRQPSADVQVVVLRDVARLQGTAETTLTFTPANWNTAQTVSLTAVNNSVAEGPVSTTVRHRVVSGDNAYQGASVADVAVNIADNDAGVLVTESGGNTWVLRRQPGSVNFDAFDVRLSTPSPTPVTVTLTPPPGFVLSSTVPTLPVSPDDPLVLTFAANDMGPKTVYLAAFQASLSISAPAISFGNVQVGVTSAAQTITLSNTEAGNLRITNLTAAMAPFARTMSGTCPAGASFVINGNASCTLAYTFAPTVTGAANQSLTVSANAPGSGTIALSGTGIQGNLTITPSSVDFGTQNTGSTSAVRMVTLSNTGTASLNVTTLTAAAAPFARTAGGSCPATLPITLAAGASCTLTYTFAPVAVGAANQNLTVAANAPGSGTLSLTGTGVLPPDPSNPSAGNDRTVGPDGVLTQVTFAVTSASGPYNGLAVTPVTVNVVDNTALAVRIIDSSPTGITVAEGGSAATYQIVLTQALAVGQTVTVTPSASGLTLSPASVTFNDSNWNTAQTISVTAVNDAIAQGERTLAISHAAAANPMATLPPVQPINVKVTDNDTVGVVVSETARVVTEGQAAQTYTLRLNSQPANNVVVDVGFDQAQLTVNSNTTGTVALTFTSANWSTPQTVSVLAVNDDVREQVISRTIAHRVSSTDAAYNRFTAASVMVTVNDNDTTLPSATAPAAAIAEGSSANLVVSLGTRPRSPVTIRALGDSELGVPATTVVQPQNWQTPVNVAVSALTDVVWEGPHAGLLRAVLESDDPNFNGRLISVPVQITNTNLLGIESTRTPGSSNLTEGSGSVTWSYRLRSQPRSDVVLQVNGGLELCVGTSSNLGACASSVDLTFTSANWSTAQTVFVGARDDSRAERPAVAQQGTQPVNDPHTGFLKLQYRTTDDKFGRVTGINPTLETILDNDQARVLPDHDRYTLTINWQMPPLIVNESQPSSYPWSLNLVSPAAQVRTGTATPGAANPFAGTVTFTQNAQTPIAQRLYPLSYRFDVRGVNQCDVAQASLNQQVSFTIPATGAVSEQPLFRDGFEAQ